MLSSNLKRKLRTCFKNSLLLCNVKIIPQSTNRVSSLFRFNPLSANPTKWSNTLKQFVGNLPTNCLSVFEHFVKLALKGLKMLFLKNYSVSI